MNLPNVSEHYQEPKPWPTFSFRAECSRDLNAFIQQAVDADIDLDIRQITVTDPINEPHVEFRTDVSLKLLRNLLRTITDSHVMLQTLREEPLSENSLERDYDLE